MRRQQDDWNKHLQQLQKRYDELERKLFYAQQHNQHLKDDLQQKAELINKKDDMIDSNTSSLVWRDILMRWKVPGQKQRGNFMMFEKNQRRQQKR